MKTRRKHCIADIFFDKYGRNTAPFYVAVVKLFYETENMQPCIQYIVKYQKNIN
jgi:hypothetical protein